MPEITENARAPCRYGRLRTSRKPPAWPCLTIFMSAKRDHWSRLGVVAGSETGCRQRSSSRGASQLTACPWAGRPDRDADAQRGLAWPGPDGDRAVVALHDDAPCDVQAEAGAFACVLGRVKSLERASRHLRWHARAAVADLDGQVALFGSRRQPARARAARATRPCNRGAPRLCSSRVIAAETMGSSSTAAALFRPGHQHITIAIRARTIAWPGT